MGKNHSLVFWRDFAFPFQQKSGFCSVGETLGILDMDGVVEFHLLVDDF